jgi:thiamine-monophosphate kinase
MNEYQIIDLLAGIAGKLPPGYTPIGDDVAALDAQRGKLVLKSDMLVSSTDVPPGMTWRQAGRKAIAMCVSDFASKGVVPDSLMVSLGLPRDTKTGGIRSLANGFRDAIVEWGLHLIGGDTNEAKELIVDSILAGFADRIVERRGARPGEYVIVTGEFGTTSAGLKILLEGAKCSPAFRRIATRNVYRPMPRLSLGIALRDCFSSATDSSDGLAICLHSLSEASEIGMRIDVLPHSKQLEPFAALNGYQVSDLVLFGGEEYEIVGTIPKEKMDKARTIARSKGSELIIIGETTTDGKIETSGGRKIEKKGWIQLA